MQLIAAGLSLSVLLVTGAHAQAPRVALVELFTSEGCSSCPPADALLAKIAGQQVAGSLVVALSEHVTYWNSLGWRDPWSQDLFTERQNAYEDRFHLGSVYTPQVVVNGAREVLGSDAAAVSRAVGETALPAMRLSIGSITPEAKGPEASIARVTYTLQGDPAGAELYAVVAEDMVSSNVLRGENGGRKLTHVAVARNLVDLGKAGTGTVNTAGVPLPDGLRGGRHLVLFVQDQRTGKVLGVDARAFPTATVRAAAR